MPSQHDAVMHGKNFGSQFHPYVAHPTVQYAIVMPFLCASWQGMLHTPKLSYRIQKALQPNVAVVPCKEREILDVLLHSTTSFVVWSLAVWCVCIDETTCQGYSEQGSPDFGSLFMPPNFIYSSKVHNWQIANTLWYHMTYGLCGQVIPGLTWIEPHATSYHHPAHRLA